jgi:hypothetical protein
MQIKVRAALSAALFFADACFELGRVIVRSPWAGILPALSYAVSTALAGFWFLAGALQLVRLRAPRWQNWAQLIGIAGTLLMIFHAALTRVLGSYVGLGNLGLALIQVVLLHHAFDSPIRRTSASF